MVITTVHTRNASIIIIFKVQTFGLIFEEEKCNKILLLSSSSDISPKVIFFLIMLYMQALQGFMLCQHFASPEMVW